jgi:AcrR family transcriptional regulator
MAVRAGEKVGVGRGVLGRGGVGEIQRARIIAAMTDLVGERGAGGVTIAHVVARSGVSRRTFYELFDDREDCFLAAFDRALARAEETVLPAYESGGSWRERIAAGLRAALVFLEEEPQMGFLCVVGAQAGGSRALERRTHVTDLLVGVVHEGRRETRAARRPDRLVAEGLVGAALAILASRLRVEQPRPLVGLQNALMAMIVLPYLGPAAAERELKRSTPRSRVSARPREDPLRDLDMRLTYRTVRVLLAIADLDERTHEDTRAGRRAGGGAPSNRQVATAAGITDQGQISKLLSRLQALGLIENTGGDHAKGEPNAWALTPKGRGVTQTLQTQAA